MHSENIPTSTQIPWFLNLPLFSWKIHAHGGMSGPSGPSVGWGPGELSLAALSFISGPRWRFLSGSLCLGLLPCLLPKTWRDRATGFMALAADNAHPSIWWRVSVFPATWRILFGLTGPFLSTLLILTLRSLSISLAIFNPPLPALVWHGCDLRFQQAPQRLGGSV